MIGDSISHNTYAARVADRALERHDAGLGTAAGNSRLHHIDIERQVVTRTQRREPAHLVDTGRTERGGAADKAIEHHPHHDRAEMPARSGQALEHRLLRRRFVEMHRLRVELAGKGQNLLARDVARAECAETAGLEIFESERGHDWGFTGRKPDCGRYLRQSQPARPHGSFAMGEHRASALAPDLPKNPFGARPVPRLNSI